MKFNKLFLAMGIALSASAHASTNWSNGSLDTTIDFSGTVTPANYSQMWQWKTGDSLTGFNNNILEMTDDSKKLTISVSERKPILFGATLEAIKPLNGLSGVSPKIEFTDHSGAKVVLNQETANSESTGYLSLPIQDKDKTSVIGTLKLNVTSMAMRAIPGNVNYHQAGMSANNEGNVFYGGLFPRTIGDASGIINNTLPSIGGLSLNQLSAQLRAHPEFVPPTNGGWQSGLFEPVSLNVNGNIQAFSYGMFIDRNQTLEATFNNPVESTTPWNSSLNVSITYI